MKSGAIQSISINGVSFDVPSDQEVIMNLGGTVSKEFTTYGTGKTRGKVVPDPGIISGILVDVEDDEKFSKLQEFSALDEVDVSVTDIGQNSYGGSGQIIADNGITRNLMSGNTNDEFQLVAKSGKFTKL